MLGGFDVVTCHAAPSALVTAEVVPYRPNRGMYLVIERPDEAGAPPAWTNEQVEQLLAIDGVAGMWTFAAGNLRADRFDTTGYGVSVCYLDDDPVAVSGDVADVVNARWEHAPVTPELAAPFVSVRAWEWDRFSKPG
jgi:hypothetical protein